MQEALDDVRAAVTHIRADLPGDLRDPVVRKINPAGQPILTYAVASTRLDDEALSWFVDDTVARALLAVRGRRPGRARRRRDARGPHRARPCAAGRAARPRPTFAPAAPSAAGRLGGRAEMGDAEQAMRRWRPCLGRRTGRLEIALADGRRVRLDQLATVQDTVAEPRSLALLDGQPVVAFEVSRSRGAGELDVADGVRTALEELKRATRGRHHPGLQLRRSGAEGRRLDDAVVEGALLAVLVVWLFLRNWRATLVAGGRRCRCRSSRPSP